MIVDKRKKAVETFISMLSDHQVSPDNITPVINGLVENPLTDDQKCAIEVLCKINNVLADRGDFLYILYGILDCPGTSCNISSSVTNRLLQDDCIKPTPGIIPNGITVTY